MKDCATREAVRAYVAVNPRATIREIMKAVGMKSTSHVWKTLRTLERESKCCPTCGREGFIQ